MSQPQETPYLFEVSWETCNKVGGIYTVLATKARLAVDAFGDRYFLLGPDLQTNREFEETDEEVWNRLREAAAVRELPCRFGRWNIPGRPRVILVDFRRKYNKDQLLYQLWEDYGVDSISGGWDYVEPVLFARACGEIIEIAYNLLARPQGAPALAHFHEWMSGAGLLTVKQAVPEVATVFTTHATVVGRALAGAGVDIYSEMERLAPQKEAAARYVTAKHSMECATAREADCFTTVSHITAIEAKNLLGRAPDVVLPNGLDIAQVPDLTVERATAERARAKLLALATRFLGKEFPARTRLLVISGRYEFRNKGLDVFLEALARLDKELPADQAVIAFLFVMGGHKEINPVLLDGAAPAAPQPPAARIATHRLIDEANDPILEACNRLGLRNGRESKVHVIFVPAFLDGYDGLLNMPYYDALAASDLGVFPSYYEPWGYTPLESAAYAVPTITTDQAGFGLWVRETLGENHGVIILKRHKKDFAAIVADLQAILRDFLNWSDEELLRRRRAARQIAQHANWTEFFPAYRRAYETALAAAGRRLAQRGLAALREEQRLTFAGTASALPHFRNLTAVVRLPARIERLRELAYNLWWTWHPEALDLFAILDPQEWQRSRHNPVEVLEKLSSARLQEMAENEGYLDLYDRVLGEFDEYMNAKPPPGRSPEARKLKGTAPVAYFSAEYGLHPTLPLYSGGLGVLAGDHLKTASDLQLPLVGIGLLYKNGYFRQVINRDGWQTAEYPEYDLSTMPLRRVEDDRGSHLQISVDLPGRALYADVWEVRVGRARLYLLSTDTLHNTAQDRAVTARLYCEDRRVRIEQEILLGMGGVRLLRKLGITPSVYHINEGHSAFLLLERIATLMTEAKLSFDEAKEVVRSNTVFTTHTPVDAGNERFDRDIIEYYFASYVQRTGITWAQFLELGRKESGQDQPFYLTLLGLRLAHRTNGVSRIHGAVSRHLWRSVWKGFHYTEVPIHHITNGVHVASFVSPRMEELFQRYLGLDWSAHVADAKRWKRVQDIPNAQLWQVRCALRQELLNLIRENLLQQGLRGGEDRAAREEALARLNPSALIIGFARRFAPYKRADLLLQDLPRLEKLLNHPRYPVLIVFGGKAHPSDGLGIELVKKVVDVTNDPRFRGRIFFLPDYDLRTAPVLLQGADVWLNTPQRLHEASGTSGMKAAINGVLNVSIADGWWCEAYDGTNGWTIGPHVTDFHPDRAPSAENDSLALHTLLADTVVPLFFERDEADVPQQWVTRMKRSMETLIPRFSSTRMLQEYLEQLYAPSVERGAGVSQRNYEMARRLAEWKRRVPMRFSSVRLLEVSVQGIQGETITLGTPFAVSVRIDPGQMDPQELLVELVVGRKSGADLDEAPVCIRLQQVESNAGVLTFQGEYAVTESGAYAYGIRVMPYHPDLPAKQDAELVLWG